MQYYSCQFRRICGHWLVVAVAVDGASLRLHELLKCCWVEEVAQQAQQLRPSYILTMLQQACCVLTHNSVKPLLSCPLCRHYWYRYRWRSKVSVSVVSVNSVIGLTLPTASSSGSSSSSSCHHSRSCRSSSSSCSSILCAVRASLHLHEQVNWRWAEEVTCG